MTPPTVIPRGNTHEQHQVRIPTGRTPFQDDAVRGIVERDDFDFACGPYELPEGSTYRGPFAFLWYDKGGCLHLVWIGQRRILRHIPSE